MNLTHPVLQEMLKSGCSDDKKIMMGFQTYLELCEGYNLENVQFHFSPELNLIYLSGLDEGETQFYVPLAFSDNVTPAWLKEASTIICGENTDLYIVLRDTDSSHVIYKVTSGLYEPLHPDRSKELKAREDKKSLIESEIKRMIPSLIKEAMKS